MHRAGNMIDFYLFTTRNTNRDNKLLTKALNFISVMLGLKILIRIKILLMERLFLS